MPCSTKWQAHTYTKPTSRGRGLSPPGQGESYLAFAWVWVGTFQACYGPTVPPFNARQNPPSPLLWPTPPTPVVTWVSAATLTGCPTSADLTASSQTAGTTTREGSRRRRPQPGCQSPSTRCRRSRRSLRPTTSTPSLMGTCRTMSNSLGEETVVVYHVPCQSSWRPPTLSWELASNKPLLKINFSQGRKSPSSPCEQRWDLDPNVLSLIKWYITEIKNGFTPDLNLSQNDELGASWNSDMVGYVISPFDESEWLFLESRKACLIVVFVACTFVVNKQKHLWPVWQ